MKNLGAKLILIMKDCNYIQRSGFNEFHRYKFATAADVLERVNASLVKNNVCSIVNSELIDMKDTMNQNGKTEHIAYVKTTVTLIDVDSGESLTCVALGSGADLGDKSVMKAQTASLKYAYMMTLNIATGDDPEADFETDRRNAPQQAATPVSKLHVQDDGDPVCSDCGAPLTKGVLRVSMSKFNRKLCMACQRKHAA